MPSIKRAFMLLGAMFFLGCGSGCVHFSARPLVSDWTATSHVNQQEHFGLSIAAQTLGQRKAEEQFIGRPARPNGYFPIVLYFENLGEHSFVIRRTKVKLRLQNGETFTAQPMYDVYESLKYSKNPALWTLPLGIFPAIVLGDQIEEQNDRFLADLRTKAIRDYRITPRAQTYHCVAFFAVGADRAARLQPQDCSVIIDSECSTTSQSTPSTLGFVLVPAEPLE